VQLLLSDVPRVSSRLRAYGFARRFGAHVSALQGSLALVRLAAAEVRDSPSLKTVLGTVLRAGNRLNDGSVRGSAGGFALEVLPQLNALKSTAVGGGDVSAPPTLLHFLAQAFSTAGTGSARLLGEMPSLESAGRVDFLELSSELSLLRRELADAAVEVEAHFEFVAEAAASAAQSLDKGPELSSATGGAAQNASSEAAAEKATSAAASAAAEATSAAAAAASELGSDEAPARSAAALHPAAEGGEGGSVDAQGESVPGAPLGISELSAAAIFAAPAAVEAEAAGAEDEDRFQAVMRPFLADAQQACAALQQQFDDAQSEMNEVVLSYGYGTDKAFAELVAIVSAFARALQRAERENETAGRTRPARAAGFARQAGQTTPAEGASQRKPPATAPTVVPLRHHTAVVSSRANPPPAPTPAKGGGEDVPEGADAPAFDGLLTLGGGLTGGLGKSGRKSVVSMDGIRKKLFR